MSIEKELERELSFAPAIEAILAENAGKIHKAGIKVFALSKATQEDDKKNGFDFVFQMGNFTVPVRIRKPNIRFRDFTIRARSMYNMRTEIDKLREGAGDVYFYAWTKYAGGNEDIDAWWLIDLSKVRQSGLLNQQRKLILNGDGTGFVNITKAELEAHDCIIAQYQAERPIGGIFSFIPDFVS
jgi:hypothetical protein